MSIEMTVIWNVASCSLIEIDRLLRVAYYLYHHIDVIRGCDAV
jgi:hypothetical protein